MDSEKISFKDYLVQMLGKKKAAEILSMSRREREWRFVIIDGRPGPTGKSTLARVLQDHGYRTLELYEHVQVRLDDELQNQVPNFCKHVE